jgi:serine/threonine protein phosphatase PrpC
VLLARAIREILDRRGADIGAGTEILAGYWTERGPRPANEDYAAFYLGTEAERARWGAVAVIADGVGGANGGRVAAELAVRTFIDGYLGLPDILGVRHSAARCLLAINRWVNTQGQVDARYSGMACTLSALVLRGRHAHLVHVGDTRIYRLRDGRLQRLTTDHNVGKPGLTHILTRAVGAEDEVRADYAVEGAQAHDRFLLCTDGVHGALGEKRIAALLSERAAPEQTARDLVAAALAEQAHDNCTALVVDLLRLPVPTELDLEQDSSRPIIAPPSSGQVIDGFELGPVLAEGIYSRVFRARDRLGERDVVIKFSKEATAGEAIFRQAFVREAWVASRVRSPWVGEVIEPGQDRQSCLYTVVPFYPGETLERRLHRRPPIGFAEGLEIAVKLAKAVHALHRAGVIHRDIKPDNVILGPGGSLRLIDLGVARLPHAEDFPPAHAPGTPSYMAPELFGGAIGDEHTDQYALGVTIYRAFSGGAYPYGEIEPFSQPRFGKASPLSRHRPDLPAWLERTLARATAAAPESRFADLLELIQELEHGLATGAPLHVRPRSLYERDPLLVWQAIATVLAASLLLSLASGH